MKDNKVVVLLNTPSSSLRLPSPSRGEGNNLQGFTLIELLVVVLIIGILAAVAMPQYKMAVVKSRIAAIRPIVSTLRKAEESHYVANGAYTLSVQDLDVDIPCTESFRQEDNFPFWKCGNDFLVQVSDTGAWASYCPGYNDNWETCEPKREVQIGYYYYNHSFKGRGMCIVRNNSTLGESVCKNLGGIESTVAGSYWLD